jgi:PKD repeat protein
MSLQRAILSIGLLLIIIGFSYAGFRLFTASDPKQQCQAVWREMVTTFEQISCRDPGLDNACYGNTHLTVSYFPNATPTQVFDAPGDIAAFNTFASILTGALSLQEEDYGLAVLLFEPLLEGNLPGTWPGDPVKFVLYGESYVTGAPADTQMVASTDEIASLPQLPAFYFYTGIEMSEQCIDLPYGDLPEGGLLIKSPEGYHVRFNANGADFVIGSTIVLQAELGNAMRVVVLEGTATVTVRGDTVTARRNQQIVIPLAGSNGYEANLPMSGPSRADVSGLGLPVLCQIAQWAGVTIPCGVIATPSPSLTASGVPAETVTPSALPSSTRTPRPTRITRTPPRSQSQTYYVNLGNTANIRSCARRECGILATLSSCAAVTVLGEVRGENISGTNLWYEVDLDGQTAYIHSSLLASNRCVDIVASATRTPLPSLTPTVTDTVPPSVAAPIASFSASPMFGNAPLTVYFSDMSSGDVSFYQWYFGDGNVSNEANPTHVYYDPGRYEVILEVTGQGGTTTSLTQYIDVVAPPPPDAFFDISGNVVWNGDTSAYHFTTYTSPTVNFINQSTEACSFRWIFGDGVDSIENSPSHTYADGGVARTITLEAYSCYDSSWDTYSITIQIPVPE